MISSNFHGDVTHLTNKNLVISWDIWQLVLWNVHGIMGISPLLDLKRGIHDLSNHPWLRITGWLDGWMVV